MKQNRVLMCGIFSLYAILFHVPQTIKCTTVGKPFLATRSQGNNLVRRLVGEIHELLHCGNTCRNGIISITPEWSQNFNTNGLGTYFSLRPSARNQANSMNFRGSRAENPPFSPENTNVLAEYFLLASNFSGNVTLHPHIENFVTDINMRLNLYNRLPGLYFEIGVPITWTRAHVELKETPPANPGTNLAILASNNPINAPFETPAPFFTITEAYNGIHEQQEFIFTSPGVDPITITIENLNFARINDKQTKSGVADVELVAGYNLLCKEKYHFAVNARLTVPTGNRPEAVYVFEPILGNGHHLQIGGGINAHAVVWHNGCDRSWRIWFDSALYYACSTRQKRTFDIQGSGIGSRYLLLKRFDAAGNFDNAFMPGPNITTLDADVKIGLTGQAVLLADYQRGGLTVDFGYSIWGREKEKITLAQNIVQGTYGIWGGTPIDNLIPDAANRTNSQTTINGVNFVTATNPVFDMPSPHTLSNASIDIASAESPAACSHILFAHVSYAWRKRHITPLIGVGGQVELSGKQNNALNMWSVWMKMGLAWF
ncbi:MAG: hypothetical protein AB7F19_00450 [Candidatus Babeliales bacterium]